MFTIWNTETRCFASAASLGNKLSHAEGGAPVGRVKNGRNGGGVGESVSFCVSNLQWHKGGCRWKARQKRETNRELGGR